MSLSFANTPSPDKILNNELIPYQNKNPIPTEEQAAAIRFFQEVMTQKEEIQNTPENQKNTEKEFITTDIPPLHFSQILNKPVTHPHHTNPSHEEVATIPFFQEEVMTPKENIYHTEDTQKEFITTDINPTNPSKQNKTMSVSSPQNTSDRTINQPNSLNGDYRRETKRNQNNDPSVHSFEKALTRGANLKQKTKSEATNLFNAIFEDLPQVENAGQKEQQPVNKRAYSKKSSKNDRDDSQEEREEAPIGSPIELLAELQGQLAYLQKEVPIQQTQPLSAEDFSTLLGKQQPNMGENLQTAPNTPLQPDSLDLQALQLNPFDEQAVPKLAKMIENQLKQMAADKPLVFQTYKPQELPASGAQNSSLLPTESAFPQAPEALNKQGEMLKKETLESTPGEKSLYQKQDGQEKVSPKTMSQQDQTTHQDGSDQKEQKGATLNNNTIPQNLPIKQEGTTTVSAPPQDANPASEAKTLADHIGNLFNNVVHQLHTSGTKGDAVKLMLNAHILPGTSVQLSQQSAGGVLVNFTTTSLASYEKIKNHIDILRNAFSKSPLARPIKLAIKYTGSGSMKENSSTGIDGVDAEEQIEVIWDERD